MQSMSLTPTFVGGYAKNYGLENRQQLLILQDGFGAYDAAYIKDKLPKDDTGKFAFTDI